MVPIYHEQTPKLEGWQPTMIGVEVIRLGLKFGCRSRLLPIPVSPDAGPHHSVALGSAVFPRTWYLGLDPVRSTKQLHHIAQLPAYQRSNVVTTLPADAEKAETACLGDHRQSDKRKRAY